MESHRPFGKEIYRIHFGLGPGAPTSLVPYHQFVLPHGASSLPSILMSWTTKKFLSPATTMGLAVEILSPDPNPQLRAIMKRKRRREQEDSITQSRAELIEMPSVISMRMYGRGKDLANVVFFAVSYITFATAPCLCLGQEQISICTE